MLSTRSDYCEQAGIGILLKADITLSKVLVLYHILMFERNKMREVLPKTIENALFMNGKEVSLAAGLELSVAELNRFKIDYFAIGVFSLKLLNAGVGFGLFNALNGRDVLLKVIVVGVIIAIQCSILFSQKAAVFDVIEIAVFLPHGVLVHRTVVVALLGPNVILLENNVPFDAGVNKNHNDGDNYNKREDGEQYTL